MNSVRFRIVLISCFFIGVIGFFGNKLIHSFKEYKNLNRQLIESTELVDSTSRIRPYKVAEDKVKFLKEVRSRMDSKVRQTALSNVIQSYTNRHNKTLKKRIYTLNTIEAQFRKSKTPRISFLEERIQYFGYLCLGLLGAFWVSLFLFTEHTIFRPLNRLYRKMIDFSNNKYTYHFTTPKPGEVGRLHATFNSLAQQVLRNMEALQSLDQAKSDFLSIASHELRTPLTSIKGSLSLLKSGIAGKFEDKALNLMRIAETETDRLIRLINDILDLTKIEAKKLPLNKEWSSLRKLVTNTTQSMNGLCGSAKVHLTTNDIPSMEILMDTDRVQQIITNLLSNAIKYSPEGETVSLHCDLDNNNHLCISVIDRGPGIAPEDQKLIFEKFRQATGPENPLVKGTGLGLAIAKAIVEEHDGQILVRSQPNAGSTFFFTLPHWRYSIEEEGEGAA